MKKFSLFVVRTLSRVFALLPIRVQLLFGDMIGLLWFDLLRIRRKVALDNLKRCFPNWAESKRVSVARASVCNLGRSFIEFLRIPVVASTVNEKSQWKDHFDIQGLEHLENALNKGRGVCLLSAHIGNGDWGTVGLALHGIQLHIISKEFKLRWLNDLWFETRQSLGSQFISDRGSALAILKLLKKNKIVVFVLDQFMGPPIGIKTKFFGYETGTPVGLSLLADRSGAAVVPIYTYRKPDGRTGLVFEPEIVYAGSEVENKDIMLQNMTQSYCDKIEEWVRLYPEQWMWVHRRWKKYKH
ncbi:MAG: lysophospholipid acyltransferase family protein [Bdellovibrionales bacterium]|nr:lysophospholipid acyltransferase family protein [Bdellovibrionales bacterium]